MGDLDEAARTAWTAADTTSSDLLTKNMNDWYVAAANIPAAGSIASACSASSKCTTKEHCCGTFKTTSAPGFLIDVTGRCNPKATPAYTDPAGNKWTHTCGASKIFAAASAAAAALYLM